MSVKSSPKDADFTTTKPLPRPLCYMFYVYILERNKTPKFYIGYTDDLKRRIPEHQREDKWKLIYYEAYLFEKNARQRERKLKLYGSAWRALKKRITA